MRRRSFIYALQGAAPHLHYLPGYSRWWQSEDSSQIHAPSSRLPGPCLFSTEFPLFAEPSLFIPVPKKQCKRSGKQSKQDGVLAWVTGPRVRILHSLWQEHLSWKLNAFSPFMYCWTSLLPAGKGSLARGMSLLKAYSSPRLSSLPGDPDASQAALWGVMQSQSHARQADVLCDVEGDSRRQGNSQQAVILLTSPASVLRQCHCKQMVKTPFHNSWLDCKEHVGEQ